MITLTHKIITKEQASGTAGTAGMSSGMFADKNCDFDAEFYCAANNIDKALLSSDSVQSVIDAISNLTDDQILEIDHKTSASKFIESGDSRETSIEIMNAIFWLAREDDDNALQIWMDPSVKELLAIFEIVTNNGLRDSSDYFWGAAGSDWGSSVDEKYTDATINLQYRIVVNPDFSGLKFIVAAGEEFDQQHFAETRGLNFESISAYDINAVHKTLAKLNAGEYLEIDYDIN